MIVSLKNIIILIVSIWVLMRIENRRVIKEDGYMSSQVYLIAIVTAVYLEFTIFKRQRMKMVVVSSITRSWNIKIMSYSKNKENFNNIGKIGNINITNLLIKNHNYSDKLLEF